MPRMTGAQQRSCWLRGTKGKAEIVRVLLDKGADINAKDNHGFTALGLAKRVRHEEIAQLLKAHGATQ